MKVVNLKFLEFSGDEDHSIDNITRQEKMRSECQAFCFDALVILQKTNLTKLEEFRNYLGFDKIHMMETIFTWFIQHENCANLQKNQEKFAHLSRIYQEELNRKELRIQGLENYNKHAVETLAIQRQQIQRKDAKLGELQGHVTSLARMAKQKALMELNQYGQDLLKSFKIQSSGYSTPEDIDLKNRTQAFFVKKKHKKCFLSETRNLVKNNSPDLSLLLKANSTSVTDFRITNSTNANSSECTKRSTMNKLTKIQGDKFKVEDIKKLEEEKENCLSNMSQRISLFQKKMANIEQKIEVKKKLNTQK